jgi:sugar (glycoside-pentoside-hexuronide) transporter
MNKKTSYLTRFSYAAPDIGGQLVFQFIISGYLSKFFTDVYGLTALACANIMLMARWIDAVDAPVWGIIFDKTNSRWGKSRPWFLWLCVPFAVFGVLTYQTPDLSYTAKVWYAAITYIGCSVLYTGLNTPVTSILSTLTADPQERVTLTCFRMLGSKLGTLAINLTALRLVKELGHGDDRRGYMLTVPIFAAISVVFFLIAFTNLKEVVPVVKKREPILGTFRALKGNWPWLIIFASSFLFWIGFIARISTMPYYFQYVLHREDLTWLAYSLDFVSLGTALGMPWFCKWTSKRTVWAIGLLGMVLGQLVLAWGAGSASPQEVTVCYWFGKSVSLPAILFGGWFVGFLFSGMAMAMPFSVLSDSVDYGEWKTGVRAVGLLTAVGAAFCLKAGAGLGGAIPLWIMGSHGYVANTAQTAGSLKAIGFCFVWLPAFCLFLAAAPVFFYKRFELLEPRIHADLEARRKALPA